LKINAKTTPTRKPDKCPSHEIFGSVGKIYQIKLPYKKITPKDKAVS
jgi:hypothetical protein